MIRSASGDGAAATSAVVGVMADSGAEVTVAVVVVGDAEADNSVDSDAVTTGT